MVKDKYGLDTSEVELDTSGVEEKEIQIENKQEETKEPVVPKFEVTPDGTAVNEHKNDKVDIEVIDDKKEETSDQPKQDLKKHTDNVQSRIGELTKNWRESQRREKAALNYAKGLQKKMEDLQQRFPKLEENYLKEFESRIKTDTADASREMQVAIENQDSAAIAKANQRLVQLSIENERLANTKYMREQEAERIKSQPVEPEIPEIPASPKAKAWAEKTTGFCKTLL
jgi:hypothetical protein